MRPTRFPFSIQFSKRMTLHVSNAFIIAKWKSIHLWTDLPSRFPSHSVGWLLDDALPIPERRHERWRKWVQTLKLPSTCVAHTCNPEQNGCVELHSSMMRRMKNDEEKNWKAKTAHNNSNSYNGDSGGGGDGCRKTRQNKHAERHVSLCKAKHAYIAVYRRLTTTLHAR